MEDDDEATRLVRTCEIVLMPVPVIAELRFGFLNGTKSQRNVSTLARFLDAPRVEVLPCGPSRSPAVAPPWLAG